MFSSGQSRKTSAPPKDLFSGFSPTSKVVVRSVIKPRQPAQSLNAPRTSSPLSRPPNKPSPSASLPPSKALPTKRKRASSREVNGLNGVKKPRRSKDLDRVASPGPSRSARSSLSRSLGQGFGTLEKPVPRPWVVTNEDGNVPHVTSEEVTVRFLSEAAAGKKGKKGYRACEFIQTRALAHRLSERSYSLQESSGSPGQVFRARAAAARSRAGLSEHRCIRTVRPHFHVKAIQCPNHVHRSFVVLYPTDRDDYQPVRELVRTITTIVECKPHCC